MKIYGISGLGADERVFDFLALDCNLIPIQWIEPKHKENLEDYSARLSQHIDAEEPFGILGVSFGGLVAVEISKKLNPRITILVSSAETKYELRALYRIIGKMGLIKIMPTYIFNPPRVLAHWVFGTKRKKLLNQILDDTDFRFAKWAVNELVNWKNEEKLSNQILKICGTHDKLIPRSKCKTQKLIEKGGHFMIVDKADEISKIINETI